MALLKPGLYEQLLSFGLQRELDELATRHHAELDRLPHAEAPDRIALHLAQLIKRAVAGLDESERTPQGLTLARRIIQLLMAQPNSGAEASDQLVDGDRILRSIATLLPSGEVARVPTPDTPLLDTTLLTNAQGEPNIGHQLRTEIPSADRIDVLMAFVRTTGTDANGNTHVFTYDKTNQVQTEARPSGATIHYAYDATGHLTQRTSPNGERRQYDYDAAGRKTEERHYPKDATEPSQTIVYTYDERNTLTGHTQTGDTHSAATYSYDANGQKTEETVTYGEGQSAFSLTTQTRYTQAGHKQSFTYPDNTKIDYTYTANGLLNTASLANSADTIHWQTYQWQQPTKITMPGATRTIGYDALQRPTHIKSQAIGQGTTDAPTGDIIMDYRYTYDAAGNITQRETEEGAYQYGYDLIDRLTAVTPPADLQQNPAAPEADKLPLEAYSYDPVHNRLTDVNDHIVWSGLSEAFGKTAATTSVIDNPLRFPGQYEDGESQSHYNYHRNYSSIIGRYFQADPLGMAGGVGEYIYAEQGPLVSYDNLGLKAASCCEGGDMSKSECCEHANIKNNWPAAINGDPAGAVPVCCNGKKYRARQGFRLIVGVRAR